MANKARILEIMEQYGLSQSELADQLGVPRPSINHILSERNKPGVELLQKILALFPDVNSRWLMLGEGPMIAPQPKRSRFASDPPVSTGASIPNPPQAKLFAEVEEEARVESNPKAREEPESSVETSPEIEKEAKGESLSNNPATEPAPNPPSESKNIMLSKNANSPIKRITVYYSEGRFEDFVAEG